MDQPRFQYDLRHCALARALGVVGEKWALLVVREAYYGLRRFDDFARALGCGRGVLSARLKTLTEEGVLERRTYLEPGRRAREEYRLTDKGRDLFPAVLALMQWSERWMPSPAGPVAEVVSRRSREPVRIVMTTDPDVEPLAMREVEILPGPGATPR